MSRGKEFIKNTIILFIGKFATQFTSFLLIPLFTHYLLTDDYGLVDLLQTYILLFVPVLTLRLDSALFRFLIDKRKDEKGKRDVISNVMYITLIVVIISLIIMLILRFFINIKYFELTIINIIILMFSNVMLQSLRGLGKNKEYSVSCIISALVTIISNIILIIFLKKGADSILISSSLANFIVLIYVCLVTKFKSYLDKKSINKKIIKELLKYSLPMIPNSLSWWIVNVSDRTIISLVLGSEMNGIYSISCKFSNLLNSVFSIFNISWQETASMHINDADKDDFFSKMINEIFKLFACISLIMLAAIPLFFSLIIGKNYIEAYKYIPILLYANSWNIVISLIGGIYIAMKKTREIAITTILSAVINAIINIIFIRKIGLYAAALSTLVAYFSMAIYRIIDIKKYLNIRINYSFILLYSFVFLIVSIIYQINILLYNIILFIIIVLLTFYLNKEKFRLILSKIKRKK